MNKIKVLKSLWIVFLVAFTLGAKADKRSKDVLNFIPNQNQWESQVRYKTDLQGGHVYFADNHFRFVFYDTRDIEQVHHTKHEDYMSAYNTPIHCYAYDVSFLGAASNPTIESYGKKGFYHNYFIGNDSKKWAGNVPVYSYLNYKNMYPGVDVKTYSEGTSFKYDVIVHPGASANTVALKYNGLKPNLLPNGNLQLPIGFNTLEETAPYTYQWVNGEKVTVKSKFVLSSEGVLTYDFPDGYDKTKDLIIDPTLVFATYSGSTGMTFGFSATYDVVGSLYAGGECFAVGWPSTLGAFQLAYGGGVDAGINKYTPTGNALVYSTYYGGSGSDLPNNMVVNATGELAITGSTSSPNLATTPGCFDNTLSGTDAYVAHFNATGSALIGATYIGGSGTDASNAGTLSPNYGDANRGEIFFDTNDEICVAVSTSSIDFPVTPGTYQSTSGGQQDGCFFKLNSTCSNLIFSTYIGGSGFDAAFSIAKKSNGNWVLCGGTTSANFPTTPGSAQPALQGGTDGFVLILNNNANSLVASSIIGTSAYDHAFKVQVDPNDSIYVCGQTSGATFPVSPGVYNVPNSTIYFQKYTPDLSALSLSTRIGQTSNLVPTAFLKDNCGNLYFSGFQAGVGLALTPNAFQTTQGGFWLAVLSGDFTQLVYATYMGATGDHVDGGTSRFDPQGIVYQSVCTSSPSQYQSPGCWSPNNMASSWDVASFKFDFEMTEVIAGLTISPNDSGCVPHTVVFTNTSQSGLNYAWDFGDGNTSNLASPTHTFLTPGLFTVRMVATNPNSCVPADTAYVNIRVIPDVDASFTSDIRLGCVDDTVRFTLNNVNQPNNVLFSWNFGDGTGSSVPNPSHVYFTQGIYTVTCIASNGFCNDTIQQVIDLNHPISAGFTTQADSICVGTQTIVTSNSTPVGYVTHAWNMGDGTLLNSGLSPLQSHSYANPGTYTITLVITDTLGCTDTATRVVFVDALGDANFTMSDSMICEGDPVFFDDTLSSNTVTFSWDFGDGKILKDVHNPSHTWDVGGNYNVILTAKYPVCPDIVIQKPVMVDNYPSVNLGPDTAICPGLTGSILLYNLNNQGSINQWSTGESASSITVTQPGHYWLRASNGECATVDTIWIKRDCYLNIPNSFSPTGDGLNEYFLPREILSSGLKSFKMNIYNRWGENIFFTDKIDGRGWDGKYNGKLQPIGSYVYVIEAVFDNNMRKTFKGNVTLIR
jgi:gliding motility-associated-like protein